MTKRADRPVLGWREWVRLPDWSTTPIKAKVDTGARTSSLHAFRLRMFEAPDGPIARFELHPIQRSKAASVPVEARILEFRSVRSSNGRTERRPVVSAPLQVGSSVFNIEVTLTSRDEMGFRMLLGRSAVRHRYVVDPGRSFVVPLIEPD